MHNNIYNLLCLIKTDDFLNRLKHMNLKVTKEILFKLIRIECGANGVGRFKYFSESETVNENISLLPRKHSSES